MAVRMSLSMFARNANPPMPAAIEVIMSKVLVSTVSAAVGAAVVVE